MQEQKELETRLALLEQKVDLIINNHLAHMAQDIDDIKRYFLYGIGVVFTQLVAVIAFLLIN